MGRAGSADHGVTLDPDELGGGRTWIQEKFEGRSKSQQGLKLWVSQDELSTRLPRSHQHQGCSGHAADGFWMVWGVRCPWDKRSGGFHALVQGPGST